MREAILTGAADLGAVRPRKSASKRKPPARDVFRGILRLVRSRVLPMVVWSGFAILMGGIVLNATTFQKGRHPAPLFGAPPPAKVARSRQPAAAVSSEPATATAEPAAAPPPRTAVSEPAAGPDASPASARPDGGAHLTRAQASALPDVHHPDSLAGDAKRVRAAARVRPGQPHVRSAVASIRPRTTDRARLTAMMAAAAKPRRAMAQAGAAAN